VELFDWTLPERSRKAAAGQAWLQKRKKYAADRQELKKSRRRYLHHKRRHVNKKELHPGPYLCFLVLLLS